MTAGDDTLLGHELLVSPHIDIEESGFELCLPFDSFSNRAISMYAETFAFSKKGLEYAGFCPVLFFKHINYFVVSMVIGKVQV